MVQQNLIGARYRYRLSKLRSLRCALLAAVLICLVPFLSGQIRGPNSSIHGIVRDAQGQPVPYAIVHLIQTQVVRRTATADVSGEYEFTAVAPGDYVVTAEAPLSHAKGESLVSVARNQIKKLEVTLLLINSGTEKTSAKPTFDDEPHFTVSGVTDTTALGGHGSDTVVRTRDSLAKDTASHGSEIKPVPPLSREALEAERDRAEASIAKDPNKAEPHQQLADAEEQLGDSLAAVREYQRAAELDPSEPYLFDWGSELLLHHAPEPALEVFAKGNRLFPKSERMLLGLGAAWFALGSLDTALEKFRDASNLPAHSAEPYYFAGKVEMAEKIPSPLGVEMLHRFVTDFPDSFWSNYYYGTALWRSREASHDSVLAAEVEILLRKASECDSHLPAAHLELGIVHADMHEYEKAISEYQQAIELASELESLVPIYQIDALAQAHFRLAEAYRQSGDRKKSAFELQAFEKFNSQAAQQTDQERHEILQFVYTLRDQPAPK